jgi:hypothetical protein
MDGGASDRRRRCLGVRHSPIHIEYENPGWSVRARHEEVARSHHLTQEATIEAGKALARRLDAELIVHEAGGQVIERKSSRRSSS